MDFLIDNFNNLTEEEKQQIYEHIKERCSNVKISEIFDPKNRHTAINAFRRIREKDKEIAKAILEMGYDRTNYEKKDVSCVIYMAVRKYLDELEKSCNN